MSQGLQFYKLKYFPEQVIQNFPRENVYESIKSLLKGSDPYASEMIEVNFELVPLDYVGISVIEIEKIIPSIDNQLKYIFDPHKSTFFMVDEKIWFGVEKIIESLCRDILKKKNESEMTERLKNIYKISSDHALLSRLFENKLLFVNIF